MGYHLYTPEEFFHDPNFRKWVLNPDAEIQLFWENWVLNHPEKDDDVAIAKKMVKSIQMEEYEWDIGRKNALWRWISFSTQEKEIPRVSKDRFPINCERRKKISVYFLARAASLALLAMIALYGIFMVVVKPTENTTAMETKSNPSGQKSKVFLPDGSKVYLNSKSSMTYPLQFGENKREISLDGEAFFEVVSDSLKPFTVTSGEVEITVLGTSFNVKAFPGDNFVCVSLVEGEVKVGIKNHSDEAILKPGEAATMEKATRKLVAKNFDYWENIAWKDGILYLNQTRLDEAFSTLELWYGVEFKFNNPPDSSIKVTGKFENAYLTNVLKSLSYSVNFDYAINGKEVKMNFN